MIPFNEETVSTPPTDVIKIAILERREQVIEMIEEYNHKVTVGADAFVQLSKLRSRTIALWYQLEAIIERKDKSKNDGEKMYDMIERLVTNEKYTYEIIILAFKLLNRFCDDLGLTFIDTKQLYDRSRIEDSNMRKGI